jgi:hypothetical protein
MFPIGRMRIIRVMSDGAAGHTAHFLRGRGLRATTSSPYLRRGKWWEPGSMGNPGTTYTRIVIVRPKGKE